MEWYIWVLVWIGLLVAWLPIMGVLTLLVAGVGKVIMWADELRAKKNSESA